MIGRRILIVGNTDHSMVHFRKALVGRLVEEGYDVHVVVPAGPYVGQIEALGAKVTPWKLSRRSTNPFRELQSLVHLAAIHRRLKPDICHYFSLKPALYGPFAASAAGIRRTVGSITGLGYVFTGTEPRARFLRWVVVPLCSLAFRLSGEVLFQNEEDRDTLRVAGALPRNRGRVLHGGEGVDCSYFDPASVAPETVAELRSGLGIPKGMRVVLLVARLLGHKGVREYVEAARALKGRAAFLLVGPIDPQNPSWIPHDEVEQWHAEGIVIAPGERSDIRELLALADIAVLPSYREGTSQFLLEAAAMGRAAVAADVPGCRLVVEDGRTGFLVRARDSEGLTKALEQLLADDDLREGMGRTARERALEMFDVRRVVDRLLGVYAGLGREP